MDDERGSPVQGGAPRRRVDGAIAKLAARQHGVVARRQLLELGIGREAIAHRVTIRRLHRVHRGVYAVGHAELTGRGRLMAAVLACGKDAVLSHATAAFLWGLMGPGGPNIDVTVTHGTRRRDGRNGDRRGIRLHRTRRVEPADRAVVDGIPVTSLARTILDVAEDLSRRRLRHVLEQAERLQVFDLVALDEICERSPGRRAVANLRAALIEVVGPPPDTRSGLEQRFRDFCEDHGLPPPAMNVVIEGFVVDATWPETKVVIELDSWRYHRNRAAFEDDHERDRALKLASYELLRLTSRQLDNDGARAASTIRRLMGTGAG